MYWALTGENVPTMIPKKNKLGLAMPETCKPPHKIRKRLPIEVSELVMDCVKNEPSERPPNMMNVVSRLDSLVHDIFGGKLKTGENASKNN